MRVALAQLNFTVGAFDGNYRKMADAAEQGHGCRRRSAAAVRAGHDRLSAARPADAFPALSTANLALRDRVAALSTDQLGIVVGCAEPNEAAGGKPLFNTAVLCHRGQVVGRHRKTLLPSYDVFDEDRYFEAGHDCRPLMFKGVRLGVTVCEEAWNDPEFWPRRLYPRDPVADLAAQGVDLFVNISSSPFEMGKAAIRRDMIRQHAARHRVPFLYLNQVGGNDELIFDGHSLGFDADGDHAPAGRRLRGGVCRRRRADTARAEARPPQQQDREIASGQRIA